MPGIPIKNSSPLLLWSLANLATSASKEPEFAVIIPSLSMLILLRSITYIKHVKKSLNKIFFEFFSAYDIKYYRNNIS